MQMYGQSHRHQLHCATEVITLTTDSNQLHAVAYCTMICQAIFCLCMLALSPTAWLLSEHIHKMNQGIIVCGSTRKLLLLGSKHFPLPQMASFYNCFVLTWGILTIASFWGKVGRTSNRGRGYHHAPFWHHWNHLIYCIPSISCPGCLCQSFISPSLGCDCAFLNRPILPHKCPIWIEKLVVSCNLQSVKNCGEK